MDGEVKPSRFRVTRRSALTGSHSLRCLRQGASACGATAIVGARVRGDGGAYLGEAGSSDPAGDRGARPSTVGHTSWKADGGAGLMRGAAAKPETWMKRNIAMSQSGRLRSEVAFSPPDAHEAVRRNRQAISQNSLAVGSLHPSTCQLSVTHTVYGTWAGS